ncbi:MAG: pilus assembly protein TadG-related protein [Bacteroidota bacterium]
MSQEISSRNSQRGAVAIIVGLALAVLVGFAGLAIDLGRLYVNKTELQNAADACALAASRELTCSAAPCPASNLLNAQAAGIYVAGRDSRDLQSSAVSIDVADVEFSTTLAPNSSYRSIAGGANPASKYVMCTARSTGLLPWFMGVLGIGAQNVSASAVATLTAAQSNCGIPMALCSKGPAPSYGLTVGQWYGGRQDASGGASGNFNWVDFTPPSGGANELKDLLSGTGVCNMNVTNPVGQTGMNQGAVSAFNSRFGLYKGGGGNPQIGDAPPDYSGFAYTSTAVVGGTPNTWPAGSNALNDFLSKRNSNAPYGSTTRAGNTATGLSIPTSYSPTQAAALATQGADRRLVTSPIVDCAGWSGGATTTPIQAWACVLLLHPIDGPTSKVFFEYRGLSSDPSSPCATSGAVGGPGSVGPQVPALVQ